MSGSSSSWTLAPKPLASKRGTSDSINRATALSHIQRYPQPQLPAIAQPQNSSALLTSFPSSIYCYNQPESSTHAAFQKTLGRHHYRLPKASRIPAVFEGKRFRSGKWISEEETYADVLIDLFQKGRIKDCENGTTLRAFLGQKLHCAPMRISKKYAGKGIGKMIYLLKRTGVVDVSEDDQAQSDKQLKDAEDEFYKAVVPGIELSKKYPSHTGSVIPTFRGLAPLIPPGIIPYQLPSYGSNPSAGPALENADSPLETADHTKQLHLSYLHALQQTNESLATAGPKDLMDPALKKTIPMPYAWPLQVLPTPTASLTVSKPCQRSQSIATEIPATANSSGPHSLPEFTDFLSVFDSVTKEEGSRVTGKECFPEVAMHTAPQYSPPFTSRSFDDLHRFLGKDLEDNSNLSLPLQAQEETVVPCGTLSPKANNDIEPKVTNLDTMALFSADSYAMFAQESALAMSQHSAYLHPSTDDVSKIDTSGLDTIVKEHYGLMMRNEVNNYLHTFQNQNPEEEPRPSPATQIKSSIMVEGTQQATQPGSYLCYNAPQSSSTYRKAVGNPLTRFAPMSRLFVDKHDKSAIVSGSDASISATDFSSTEGTSGSGASSGYSDGTYNESETGSSDGTSDEGRCFKKRRHSVLLKEPSES